jgi:hypothetical protein
MLFLLCRGLGTPVPVSPTMDFDGFSGFLITDFDGLWSVRVAKRHGSFGICRANEGFGIHEREFAAHRMMDDSKVERSKIRFDSTPISETDGARRNPQGASASQALYNTWEAEVGSPHPSVRPRTILPSRPAPAPAGARSGGQGWPAFGPPPAAARSVLDRREHDGSIVRRRGPRSATRHRASHQRAGPKGHSKARSCSPAAALS